MIPSFSAVGATIDVDGTSGVVAVDGKCSLVEAIENANGFGTDHNLHADCSSGSEGTDTLVLKNDVTLTSKYAPPGGGGDADGFNGTPSITSKIIIDGGNWTLARNNNPACNIDQSTDVTTEYRLIHVAGTGDLKSQNLNLTGGCADGLVWFPNSRGGAILNRGKLSIDNSTFSANQAGSVGGAISSDNSISSIMNSVISGNSALSGGAIFNEGVISSISNSTLSTNTATAGPGGGITHFSGTISKIIKSTFTGNIATSGDGAGGALYVNGGSTVTDISNNTFSNNLANHNAGGGHAIYQHGSGIITTLKNNTFFQDDYSFDTYVLSFQGVTSQSNLINNLFTGRNSGNVNYCLFANSPNSRKNITNYNSDLDPVCHDTTLATLTSIDVALKDNGCVTPSSGGASCVFTLALLNGSTAINAGTNSGCPIDDQRGYARDANCDIGAYEYGATTAPIPEDCSFYVLPKLTTFCL